MSILFENECGWFICSQTYFNNIYRVCFFDNEPQCSFCFRSEFFKIITPYVMKSSAMKKSSKVETKKQYLVKDKKVKKNNKLRRHKILQDSYLLQVETIIKERSALIVKSAQELGFLDTAEITPLDWFQNNADAVAAAKSISSKPHCLSMPLVDHSKCDAATSKSYGTEVYLLPPKSTFYLCDVRDIHILAGQKFNLIVLDPPWENKSAKRNKTYAVLNEDALMNMNIQQLCIPGCLIVVWVTNNSKQIRFVKEKLFPSCNVNFSAIWHWMKVTQKSSFVHPINWHHKKPYENILLGRVKTDDNVSFIQQPENDKVIVSVPSSIHSHKPPLVEILKRYLPENPKCLELFSRYLLPEWTSLGNEVLKLQNIQLFKKIQ